MQDAQLRWMVGLSVLVLVLVAALSIAPEPEGGADPEATAQVLSLPDIAQVTRVSIARADGTLAFTKRDDVWELEAPYTGDADADVVFRLLDDLREMARGTPIDDPGDPSEYGLGDPPVARVHVELADGTSQDADFGQAAPVGWRTYARDTAGRIVAVGARSDLLDKGVDEFRDRRVIALDPGAVRRVTLTSPDGVLDVRGKGLTWWLEGFTRADPDRVDDLVMGLLDLRFDQVLAMQAEIDEPQYRVEVGLEDGTVLEVQVGAITPMGALVRGPRASGMVFPDALALLRMGPTDVGDRTAFGLSLERDDRVVVDVGGTQWEASRDDERWTSGDRDEAATWTRLNGLAQAAIAYQREAPPPPSTVEARVEVHRGGRVIAVEVGPVDADGFRTCRDVAGGSPYRVRDAALIALFP